MSGQHPNAATLYIGDCSRHRSKLEAMIAEKALIARIRRLAKLPVGSLVRVGIGDDCAVLELARAQGKKSYGKRHDQDNDTLVTTDFSLEGIHFRRDWHPPESVAHRCLTRGLSDIAAMGGNPIAAFLSMALPANLPPTWLSRFVRSLLRLANRHGVTLAGGDTAESLSGILADIVVLGNVPRGEAVLRSGASPGDRIYVSGTLGGSAATLQQLRKTRKGELLPQDYPRHFFPDARIEVGRILRQQGLPSAMIDTSDGFSTDLAHICEESGVGAEIKAESVPLAKLGKPPRQVALELALHGGEDYELLFTAPQSKPIPSRIAGVKITQVGRIIRGKKMYLREASGSKRELRPQGWEHFKR